MSSQPQRQGDRYKDYVPVAERIGQFYDAWPAGRVLTAIVEHDREAGFIIFRAEVYREMAEELPSATGHAQESRAAMPGHMQASYLEVCESSAVGRALMLLGFETKRGAHAEAAQRAEQPQRPGPRSVEPDAKTIRDADIMTALDALGKDEEWLNVQMRKRWPQFKGYDWSDLGPNYKHDLWLGLNRMVNERSATK